MTVEPYYADDLVTVLAGNCLAVLPTLTDASVDAVVTDPPYGLEFMGVAWDTMRGDGKPRVRNEWGDFGSREHARRPEEVARLRRKSGLAFYEFSLGWAAECLRVLKPGGHLLAFGGTRTWHRLACAVEDAGFEIRDSISWLYGSGFPKSLNVGDGRGTALKPAHEPIVVARKPLAGTVAANVLTHGTGALNVDACRIEGSWGAMGERNGGGRSGGIMGAPTGREATQAHDLGRWPTNVLLDETQAAELDTQSGVLTSGALRPYREQHAAASAYRLDRDKTYTSDADSGGASRFFPTFRYEAKAPTSERPTADAVLHPTVKPLDLMRWLVRLITPRGGLVLDPFLGSGTTAEACIIEGFRCIGIERETAYLPLIAARLSKPIAACLDFGEVQGA